MPTFFKLAKATSRSQTFTNCIYMHPNDMKLLNVEHDNFICVEEVLTFRCRKDENLKEETIGTSLLHWQALKIEPKEAIGKIVKVEKWEGSTHNEKHKAKAISFVVDTYAKTKTKIEANKLISYISDTLGKEIFCKDQKWIVCWQIYGKDYWISLRVARINISNNNNSNKEDEKSQEKSKRKKLKEVRFGTITSDTFINIMAAKNPYLELKWPEGSIKQPTFDNVDPEKMGIGGLDSQFSVIFRRAFASRLYPPDLIRSLGVKHVKGMLLYGPPGTGKTLIARSIGSMLTDNEPKVVNGPEILNKYVGQSEENIRNLFEDAIKDQEENGEKSGLHIIIFDEIDAICKQRGSQNSGTGVHDTVVNQLLSMIDGVNSLNNVLVIGMTNRKDLIDSALLRSGRLEVHIEIGLPDEVGREQIFRIHTRKLRESGFLDETISLSEYAKRTKNYTGAEIEGVVRSAISFAMQENIDPDNLNNLDINKLRNIKITKEYFEMALEEVKPEFGSKDDEIELAYTRGIIEFNKSVSEIISFTSNVVKKLKKSSVMNRQAILLRGEMGSGKTALAYYLAQQSLFPFLRVISADDYIGRSDSSICQSIAKTFDDAYKSNLSIIIIDDLERLIGYTVGPRFSNIVLQALLTVIRKQPKELDRKILIIVTSTNKVIRQLEIDRVFDYIRDLPLVNNKQEFKNILLQSSSSFNKKCKPNIDKIISLFPDKNGNIPISHLLTILELSINDNNLITQKSFNIALKSKLRGNNNYKLNDFDINLDDF